MDITTPRYQFVQLHPVAIEDGLDPTEPESVEGGDAWPSFVKKISTHLTK